MEIKKKLAPLSSLFGLTFAQEAATGPSIPKEILGIPSEKIISYGINILIAIVILIIGLIVADWAARSVKRLANKLRLEPTVAQVLTRLTRTAVIILALLAILNRFGLGGIVATLLATAGLAIALSLQGTLGNIASGIMLLVLRPFKLGDLVEVDGTLGIVKDIGLFVTQITTPDNIAVYLPNTNIFGNVIKNLSENGKLRLDMVYGISYDDDINKAIEVVKGILDNDTRVLKDPPPTVAVGGHGASSVDLWVRPFVSPDDYWDVYLDSHKKIKEAFDAAGISIPFPQRDVHIIDGKTKL